MSAKRAKKTSAKRIGVEKPLSKAAKKPNKAPALKVAPVAPNKKKSAPAKKAAKVAPKPSAKVAAKPSAKAAAKPIAKIAPKPGRSKRVAGKSVKVSPKPSRPSVSDKKRAPITKRVPARPAKAPVKALVPKKPEAVPAKKAKQAPSGSRDSKMKSEGSSTVTAKKKPTVLRVAPGQRTPPPPPVTAVVTKSYESTKPKTMRRPAKVVELNPRVESTRGLLPKVEQSNKPMSAAEKTRAAAEAAFAQVAPKLKEAPAPAPVTTTPMFHKSEFELRISERDSLTTQLRTTADDDQALAAAQALATRFKLPPDQALLVRVLGLGDHGLALLALEELLELDDRGRVRKTDDLVEAITKLSGKDPEIRELRELFLEKLTPRA